MAETQSHVSPPSSPVGAAAAATVVEPEPSSSSSSSSSTHELQVEAYLRFARFKREQHLKEVAVLFRDFEHVRTEELVFTQANVREMLRDLLVEVHTTLEVELEHSSHGTALLLRLLFEQAEEAGLEMCADLNKLENMTLLAEIKNCEQASMHKPASTYAKLQGRRLTKINSGSSCGTDARVIMERDSLREELGTLKETLNVSTVRSKTLQRESAVTFEEVKVLRSCVQKMAAEVEDKDAQLAKLLEECQSLQKQISVIEEARFSAESREAAAKKDAITESQASSAAALAESATTAHALEELQALKVRVEEELREVKAELELAQSQLQVRLNESRQFATMKKMMQSKSDMVHKLRKRLQMYEPLDSIPDADAE